MSIPIENFYKSLFEPNGRHLPGNKISSAPENNRLADLYAFEIKGEI